MLVGDGGTGKTTFVKRHLTGEFEKKYVGRSIRGWWGFCLSRTFFHPPRLSFPSPHPSSHSIATLGVDVHPLPFSTNHGDVIFDVWDTAGQEKFGGLRDGYYINGKVSVD